MRKNVTRYAVSIFIIYRDRVSGVGYQFGPIRQVEGANTDAGIYLQAGGDPDGEIYAV